jgi:hypothetical protein
LKLARRSALLSFRRDYLGTFNHNYAKFHYSGTDFPFEIKNSDS